MSQVKAVATDLFFSEYVEGNSLNRALEIFNGTGGDIDLGANGYKVEIYFNGSSSPGATIALTGIVANGDVFVLADGGADAAILSEADQLSSSTVFNGNDAVVLMKGAVVIDAIGQVGFDPGSQWGSGDASTQDNTIRRKAGICSGDVDSSDPFDPALEWDGFATNTFDGLGIHTGCPTYTPIYDIQYTVDPSGDSPFDGQTNITTEGIVIALYYNGYFIEDPSGGAWNGLWVNDSNTPALGDRLRLTGTVDEYYNLTELRNLTSYQVLSSGNPIPEPEVLATGDVSQEQWEGVLVRVENVVVIDDNLGYGEWSVSDGSGDVVLDDKGSYTYVPTTGKAISAITGPLDYSYGSFKILPRDDNDIIPGYTSIYDIQYAPDPSGDSPFDGQTNITTEGIVTALYYNGYYIEDPSGGAWSGLWIYDSNSPALGDRLRLTGTVDEYYNLTELRDLTSYQMLSSGNPIPDPEVLVTGDVSQEQWEGVLVRVENVIVTDDSLGYGEWSVSDSSGDVRLDDKGSYTYVPTTSDAIYAIIGPLDYSYGTFKMLPRDDDDIILSPPLVPLIINEILADPASGLSGDANGDGIRHYSQDEFIEIVNNSEYDINVSGWTLSDSYSVRHVFPAGTIISADCAIIIFGGGTPTGLFGNVVVQVASTGYLGLNNSGDMIILNDGSTDQVTVTYGAEGGSDQSITLNPDITGAFVLHSTATGSGGSLFSPGTMINGSSFTGCSGISNTPPVADAGGPYSGNEGTPVQLDASSSTDPDLDPLQYRWDFDNDGTWDTDWSSASSASHIWNDDCSGEVRVEVADEEPLTDTSVTSVTINNVAPILDPYPDQKVTAGTYLYLVIPFTDHGINDTHTATINWGDGITEAGTVSEVNGSGNITGSHKYITPGSYSISVSVVDDDGGEAIISFSVEVRKLIVGIDVKPGSEKNPINLISKGRIPVAILTTDTFDATTVNLSTIVFGPGQAKPVHYAFGDVDYDGDIDMILHFNTQELGLTEGTDVIVLSGQTLAGEYFEGSDSIVILPYKNKQAKGDNGNHKEDAPGQNIEKDNQSNGKESAPGQEKIAHTSAEGKGKNSAPGQIKKSDK
ncbi:MAG: lamin tail domain-containing protein [Dehalococcoidales bacterium]|nr:MAG: lamin tail domain-containing protein [Dehalococcoidales bacterium]